MSDSLPRFLDIQFTSPRFNAFDNLSTSIIPFDYNSYDALNGDYDKFYPCYTITEADKPSIKLVDVEGVTTEVQGDLRTFLYEDKRSGRVIGRKDNPDLPFNSNLERKTVFYSKYQRTNINTGWSIVQLTPSNQPQYLIRLLGNNNVSTRLAVDIEDDILVFPTTMPKGILIRYKNRVYRCMIPTVNLPVKENEEGELEYSIDWQALNNVSNVFYADVYLITKQGTSFLQAVVDNKRRFNPVTKDPSLVSYNVSYYHP